MLSVEGIGKTIEKAIENALLELKAPREDVDIKIINEGGLFKKAKVLVSISEDVKEKYITRKEKRERLIKEELKEKEPEEKTEPKKEEIEAKEIVMPAKQPTYVEKEMPAEQPREKREEVHVEPMEFLTGLFDVMHKDVKIDVIEDEKFITYSVEGEDLGEVIGHRGEAFYAISTLMSNLAPRGEKKVLLDIAGYKARRAESLSETAKRIAGKVAKSGRYMKLEPMNASERRIIHTALQDDDRVTTLSKGTEPRRYVIIFPKEYKDR